MTNGRHASLQSYDAELLEDPDDTAPPPAARHGGGESVVRPPLVEDPSLGASLEQLDIGIVSGAGAYLAPPPLMAQLVVPRGEGWWPGLNSQAAAADAETISDASLGDLEKGLPDVTAGPDWFVKPPPLMTRLVLPRTHRGVRRVAEAVAEPPSAPESTISPLMMNAALVLMTFVGAAAAALVFHEQLAGIMLQARSYFR
jgi:hypothetical protein